MGSGFGDRGGGEFLTVEQVSECLATAAGGDNVAILMVKPQCRHGMADIPVGGVLIARQQPNCRNRPPGLVF